MDRTDTYEVGTLFPLEPTEHRSAASDWLQAWPSQAAILRPYQVDLLKRILVALSHHRRVLGQAPTGAGKTVIIGSLIAAALLGDLRILVLATRTRLVRQLHERLDDFDLPHGVMAASLPGLQNWSRPIQIASVDTLYRRCIVDKRMPMPSADLVIFDEAHLALGASRRAILNSYPLAWHVGFTATPAKTSGVALVEQFDELVLGPSVYGIDCAESTVPDSDFFKTRHEQAGTQPSHEGFQNRRLRNRRTIATHVSAKIGGDVVENWLRIANGKRTIVFACDKKHGAQIREEFSRAGVACEQLTDNDAEDVREEVIARLEGGVTQVLVNCFLLSYGIDIPTVECIVLGRPTRSVVLYLQAIGRGMRPAPGKEHCIARGSLVLTERGEVPIEEVQLADRVWDGVSFVRHGGAVCKGVQRVITHDGITGTVDHEVMTNDGWKTLSETAHGRIRIVRSGFGGQTDTGL